MLVRGEEVAAVRQEDVHAPRIGDDLRTAVADGPPLEPALAQLAHVPGHPDRPVRRIAGWWLAPEGFGSPGLS